MFLILYSARMNKENSKKVLVGMSGGVDSSLSAYLLKEAGYEVTGAFIKVWQPEGFPCTWKDDRLDAMRVAAELSIPFVTIDLSDVYKKSVIDYMIAEYKAGRTPNPDVCCNREVKFGAFYTYAKEHDFDFVATGHYAQVKEKNSQYALCTGLDESKDQSYFLWGIEKDKLAHILFPVGGMQKTEVREKAAKANLFTAKKKDSQGLCFVGKIDFKDFLGTFIDEKMGDVVDEEGQVIGYHNGIFFYTIGERRGFIITKKTPHDTPYYVIGKNFEKNELIVSHKRITDSSATTFLLSQVNFLGVEPQEGVPHEAQYRYHGARVHVTLKKDNNNWQVSFLDTKESIPLGQSLVIYEKERVVGGGVINSLP